MHESFAYLVRPWLIALTETIGELRQEVDTSVLDGTGIGHSSELDHGVLERRGPVLLTGSRHQNLTLTLGRNGEVNQPEPQYG